MKVCDTCGTTLNNESFCPYCGSHVPEKKPIYHLPIKKTPMSVGGWIGRSLIPLIPVVGGIVYLIMLFIWSGDTTKEDSFRNWAKAQLIVATIAFILIVLVVIICIVLFADAVYSS